MVDVDLGKSNSRQIVEILLPVLLQRGLSSTVEEVQSITQVPPLFRPREFIFFFLSFSKGFESIRQEIFRELTIS